MKLKTAFPCVLLASAMLVTSACGAADTGITTGTTTAPVTESSFATETATKAEAETTVTETSTSETTETETEAVKTMKMKIGNKEVDVTWEDNASVEELKNLAASGLTI